MQTTEIESESAEEKLNGFLKENFKFPSDNMKDIGKFIQEDPELEKTIRDLPEIISKEFSQSPISLDFMDFTLPNEIVLQISIKTPFNAKITSFKKDKIMTELFDNYDSTKNYYFLSMEF